MGTSAFMTSESEARAQHLLELHNLSTNPNRPRWSGFCSCGQWGSKTPQYHKNRIIGFHKSHVTSIGRSEGWLPCPGS